MGPLVLAAGVLDRRHRECFSGFAEKVGAVKLPFGAGNPDFTVFCRTPVTKFGDQRRIA
jgi:hypothetical protein